MPTPSDRQRPLPQNLLRERSLPDFSRALDRFDEAWSGDAPPDLAQFLVEGSAADGGSRREQLIEFIKIDLEFRWRKSRQISPELPLTLEKYVARHADLGPLENLPLDLVAEEYRVRMRWGDRPAHDDVVARFPGQGESLLEQLRAVDRELRHELDSTHGPHAGDSSMPAALSALPEVNLPPRRILGDYELLEKLGEGGMGVVFKARELNSGRVVALKVLKEVAGGALSFLKSEFRTLADLSHPNLVALDRMVTDIEPAFFTMEMVEGVSFTDFVKGGFDSTRDGVCQAFDPQRLHSCLGQLALGLQALHDAGRLHRDIKPSNALVTSEGRVVLLDFGLAVETDGDVFRNSMQQIAGTFRYMSPEQAAARQLTYASDWYSVGVMLYEALTGKLPFDADRPDELQAQKLAGKFPAPRSIDPHIPEDLGDLCAALLAAQHDERPSGEQVLKGLKQTPPLPPVESVWVGREEPLEELNEAFRKVRHGHPVTVLVHGSSGIGKSTLVNRFLDQLRKRRRTVILRGRCYEQESVPYKGIDSVVDSLAKYLNRLSSEKVERLLPLDTSSLCHIFPVLADIPAVHQAARDDLPAADAREIRNRGFKSLREMLCRLGRFEELVVFVDDLQWGDRDSANLYADLIRLPDAPRCLLICTYRSDEAAGSPCVQALLPGDKAPASDTKFVERREITLGPLTDSEAARLAELLYGKDRSDPQEYARTVAKESGGDPFFIKILAQQLGDAVDGEGSQRPERGLSLNRFIWKRICRLPAEQRALLEALAAAQCPLPRELACKVAGMVDDDLREKLADSLAYIGKGADAAAEYLKAARLAETERSLDLRRRGAQRYLTSGHIDEGLTTLDDVLATMKIRMPRTPTNALASLLWHRLRLSLRGLSYNIRASGEVDPQQRKILDVGWSAASGLSVVDPIRAADFVSRNLLIALKIGEPKALVRALTTQVGHTAIGGGRSRRAVQKLLRKTREVAGVEESGYGRITTSMPRSISARP